MPALGLIFKTYWQTEYELWNQTTNKAANLRYGRNVEETESKNAEKAYFDTLQQFGQTNNYNMQNFNVLSSTNAQRPNNIQVQIQQLTK